MDNSLLLYRAKINQMIDTMETYASRLKHHVVKEPLDTLETAVRLGFPSDIAMRYKVEYYSRHIDSVDQVVNYINNDVIPYLREVANDIDNAMNLK